MFVHIIIMHHNRCADIKREKLKTGELMQINLDGNKYLFPAEFKDQVKKLMDSAADGKAVRFIKWNNN